MSASLQEVLARHDTAVTSGGVLRGVEEALQHLESLGWTRSRERLDRASAAYLRAHGGIPGESDDLVGAVVGRRAVATAESLTTRQVAELLGVDPSRVRHRIRDGQLYAVAGDGGEHRLPRWQFGTIHVLPHLRKVLQALQADLHPLEVAGFMTTPQPELELEGKALCPRDWLLGGGSVDPVVELAATVGEPA